MKKRKSKSWSMAYCGMAAALCVALMLLGTIIPLPCSSRLRWPAFSLQRCAWSAASPWRGRPYAAVSLLGLLFVPDKEIA